MNSIFIRRSIRKFLDKPVEKEKTEMLLKAAMQAPSAGNQQPWEFLIVQNRSTLNNLSDMSPYSKMLLHAPLAIILLGNRKNIGHPGFWEQDMAAAAENILLQAVELNLGSVWLGVAPKEERMEFVKKIFNLSDNLMPFAVIPVGYPEEPNIFINRFDRNKIYYENYF